MCLDPVISAAQTTSICINIISLFIVQPFSALVRMFVLAQLTREHFLHFFPPKSLHIHIHRTNTEHFMLIQRLSTPSLSAVFNFCTVKTRYFVYFMAIISLLDIISRDYTSLNEQLNATNCLRYCHSVLACRRNGCSIVIVSLGC